MRPGSLLLKFRQTFGHGVLTAYYRDVVRPRILQTAPVRQTTDPLCEIHALTSSKDSLNLIWALKSFYWASNRQYALCIHDDGSLGKSETENLVRHFPAARIVSKAQANAVMFPVLDKYPRSLRFRQSNCLAQKVFDFVFFLRGERMLLLDSDVLFFSEPKELLRRIESPDYEKNCFNEDDETAYTITCQRALEHFSVELQPKVNSGLGLIHKASLGLDWIEEFLSLSSLATGHFWRIEQTLFALCSSRFGLELLPKEYTVHLDKGIGRSPARHYVGRIRHLLYSEGIRELMRFGLCDRTLSE